MNGAGDEAFWAAAFVDIETAAAVISTNVPSVRMGSVLAQKDTRDTHCFAGGSTKSRARLAPPVLWS